MKHAYMRLGNLEFRTCNEFLLSGDCIEHTTGEIVVWSGASCHTVAYWLPQDDEGFSLQFAGNRPFAQEVNWEDFEKLARWGQEWINKNGR